MRALYAAMIGLMLLAPGPLPRALCMVSLFMVIFPSRAWLFLMATLPISLSLSQQLYAAGQVQGTLWTAWLPFAPFAILLIWGILSGRDRLAQMVGYAPAQSLCVLIPTHDDAVHLVQCVETVRRVADLHEMDVEILLADAGSTDGTLDQARELGVPVQITAPGRSNQIRQSLQIIKSDCVLVLPVDCLLDNNALPKVLGALQRNRHALGGALGMRFAFSDPLLRIVTLFSALRARFFGLSFANQGQFFRRRALATVGGYPQLPEMDDLELSIRLQTFAPALYLGGGVRASRREWSQTSYFGLGLRKLRRLCGYLIRKKWLNQRLRAEHVAQKNASRR